MNTTEAISFRPKIWNTDKANVVVVTTLVAMDVERENSNTKTLFYKHCNLRSGKKTCLATSLC